MYNLATLSDMYFGKFVQSYFIMRVSVTRIKAIMEIRNMGPK